MNILFAEDDDGKAQRVEDFIRKEFDSVSITRTRSFNSTLRALAAGSADFRCCLLDMTMPVFDPSPISSASSPPEQLAGRDLLAQMALRRISVPTIIVSMHDKFGEGDTRKTLEEITSELKAKYSPPFAGSVYYNATEEHWKSELRVHMTKVLGGSA